MRLVNVNDVDFMFRDSKRFSVIVIHDDGITIIRDDNSFVDLDPKDLTTIYQLLSIDVK